MRIHPLLRMTEVAEWVSGNFQVASHASMSKDPIGIASIGAGWTAIENYDSEITPRGITTDLVGGAMAFDIYGVFQLTIGLNLTHNESNQGRTTNIRFWNVTDGIPAGNIPIGIARNQPATNFTGVLQLEVSAGETGKGFRLEIGGGDSVTISAGSVAYDASMVSEWRGFESGESAF